MKVIQDLAHNFFGIIKTMNWWQETLFILGLLIFIIAWGVQMYLLLKIMGVI